MESIKSGLIENPFQTCFAVVILLIIIVFILAANGTETGPCDPYERLQGGKCVKDDCSSGKYIKIKEGYC
jgi:hypothetical protein